ncbi:hypothetical protein DEU56DRAFT_826672, partial [Suillus clintonianus]|uniref:uncharacterized protein n=1 Tax=Suillus clintonianus TaxID=1904413 RepID=UPI001B878818
MLGLRILQVCAVFCFWAPLDVLLRSHSNWQVLRTRRSLSDLNSPERCSDGLTVANQVFPLENIARELRYRRVN